MNQNYLKGLALKKANSSGVETPFSDFYISIDLASFHLKSRTQNAAFTSKLLL